MSLIPGCSVGVRRKKSLPCHLWDSEAKYLYVEISVRIGLVEKKLDNKVEALPPKKHCSHFARSKIQPTTDFFGRPNKFNGNDGCMPTFFRASAAFSVSFSVSVTVRSGARPSQSCACVCARACLAQRNSILSCVSGSEVSVESVGVWLKVKKNSFDFKNLSKSENLEKKLN